jgi:hypothetical protein
VFWYLFSYLINGQRKKKGREEEQGNKERKQGQIYPWKKIIQKIAKERINQLN